MILVGDEAHGRARSPADAAGERRDRARRPGHRDGRASRRCALREKKDASILVAMRPRQARRGRRRRDGRPHRRRHGRRDPPARAPAGRRPPRARGPDGHRLGPFVLLDIGANPDSTPENLAQYARMGAIFAERVAGVAQPRVALLSIGEEKGKGDAADPARDRAARRLRAPVRRQRRGQGPVSPPGRRRGLRRRHRQRRRSSSSRACRRSSSTCGAREFRRSLRGQLAYLLLRAGGRADPEVFDYETAGRLAAPRREGPVIITHGRARRRMVGVRLRGRGRRRARAGSPALDRRRARRRRAGRTCRASRPIASQPRRPRDRGRRDIANVADRTRRTSTDARLGHRATRADRRPRRHRRGRRGSPRSRSRASSGSARRGPPWRAAGWPGPPSGSASATGGVEVAAAVVARPGQALGPLECARSARPSPRRSSACSVWTSAPSRSSSMASAADRRSGGRRTGRRLALAAVFEADFGQRTARRGPGAPPGRGRERDPDGRRAGPRHRRARWSRTGTRSTRRIEPGRRPSTRSTSWPGWTARCSVAPSVRCYTPRRRPGWPSPSGSSWPGPTVETRCDAS